MVELGVVTLILGVVAAVGMPAFKRVAIAARTTAVANDLRVFASAYQTYAQQTGAYPPEAATGVIPNGMGDAYLAKAAWLRVTPIGGQYNWDYNQTQAGVVYKAAIGIRTNGREVVTTDKTQLLSLDRRIDDGNLSTGNFFLGAGNEPVFIIER